MNCLFCKIINKEIPSKVIYEDNKVIIFLDINPSSNGHMLLVTKTHYENILDLDTKLLEHIHKLIKKMYKLLKEKLHIEGLTIVNNSEYGQEIKHFHIHLIPRYNNDNLKLNKINNLIDIEDIYNKIKLD